MGGPCHCKVLGTPDLTTVILFIYLFLASELDSPPDGYDGEVDIEAFWDSICVERIARGFVPSK